MAGREKAILWVGVGLLLGSLYADQRKFVWTYEYITMERGLAELEFYYTIQVANQTQPTSTLSQELWIATEVGMTDRFDFSIYYIFIQPPGGSLKIDGLKLRPRFKLGTFLGIDHLLYMEYIGEDNFAENKWELRWVFARDRKKHLYWAFHPTAEWEKKRGEKGKWVFSYEGGIGLRFLPGDLFNLGVEIKGSKKRHYIGPTLAHGNEEMWVALGASIAYTPLDPQNPSDDFQIRLLTGFLLGNIGKNEEKD